MTPEEKPTEFTEIGSADFSEDAFVGMEIQAVNTLAYSFKMLGEAGPQMGHIGSAMSYRIDLPTNMLLLTLLLQVRGASQSDIEEPMLRVKTFNRFLIKGLEHLIEKDKQGILIPVIMLQRISEVSYDTARGLILARNTGTTLANFVIPMLDKNYVKPTHLPEGGEGLPMYRIGLVQEDEDTEEKLRKAMAEIKEEDGSPKS